MRGIPGPLEPISESGQRMSRTWWTFFSQQFGPQPTQTITAGASPYVFTAPNYRGVLFIAGGTVSSVTYSQDGTSYSPIGQVNGCFPMAGNDRLTITYTVAPTLTYVPL